MTDTDEKLDAQIRRAISGDEPPPPRPAAKRSAIATARQQFEELHDSETERQRKRSQEFIDWLRHIVGTTQDNGRIAMPFSRRAIYTGVAAAAIGAFAVGISLQYQAGKQYSDPPTMYEEGITQRKVEVWAAERHLSKREVSDTVLPSEPRRRLERESPLGDFADLTVGDSPTPHVSVTEEAVASPALAARRVYSAKSHPLPDVVVDTDLSPAAPYQDTGRDEFEAFEQNRVKLVIEEPVSTFSADVDTASYSFVRRMLNAGVLPQKDAVRSEELINYFDYDYPLPATREEPFKPTVVVTASPWAEGRKLMHIGIKGYDIEPAEKPRTNLVFLLDVSGSMNSPDKLPLVKQSMALLLTSLQPDDTVAIAVYAGAAGTVLEPTPVRERQKILDALRQLSAGGSTAGAQGIRLAYELAESNFEEGVVNRVILATDGDFNVGITDQRELQSFIERKRKQGIYLSVLGLGQGNYQDALMQTLAQNGNGVAAYIDTLGEAQKVLVDEATSTLFPIAGDVKFQVEFNPATVKEYRLIGYETRHLNREDFNNDSVDAGDVGAGHTVTAIYEFTPVNSDTRQIEDRRYAPEGALPTQASMEYAFLKIRYTLPGEADSRLIARAVEQGTEVPLGGQGVSAEVGFATAVAAFAELLKGGKYTGTYNYDDVIELALRSRGHDAYAYRAEFIQLVRKAKSAAEMRAQ